MVSILVVQLGGDDDRDGFVRRLADVLDAEVETLPLNRVGLLLPADGPPRGRTEDDAPADDD